MCLHSSFCQGFVYFTLNPLLGISCFQFISTAKTTVRVYFCCIRVKVVIYSREKETEGDGEMLTDPERKYDYKSPQSPLSPPLTRLSDSNYLTRNQTQAQLYLQ